MNKLRHETDPIPNEEKCELPGPSETMLVRAYLQTCMTLQGIAACHCCYTAACHTAGVHACIVMHRLV